MADEAAEWIELQNRFYRVEDVYRMQWEGVDIQDQLVACAPFGGPIASVRDPFKLVQVGLSSSLAQLQTSVGLFSAAGVLLSSFAWSSQGAPLVGLGWAEDQTLVLVAQDGSIVQYTLQGQHIPGTITLDSGLSPIVQVSFFGGCGVACLAEDLQIFLVPNLKDPEVISFSIPELTDIPACFLALGPMASSTAPPLASASSSSSAPGAAAAQGPQDGTAAAQRGGSTPFPSPPPLLVTLADSVIIINPDDGSSTELALSGVERVAASASGKLLGCFSSDGTLHVVVCSSSFDTVAQHDTKMGCAPDSMVWCGEDAVLAHWQDAGSLLLVGPEESTAVPEYEDRPGLALVLAPEVDGARAITNAKAAFVQRVPDPVVGAYGIGSTEPAALLFDAFEQFDKRSVKADESIRALGESMVSAVEACAEAACHEPQLPSQQALLRAAAYGRAYCSVPNRDIIRDACMTLRVLNGIKDPDAAGIPLTYVQFQVLGPAQVVGLLLANHRHLLALRVSQYLSLPEARVLEHWAATKIASSSFLSDDDLYVTLMGKLKQQRGVNVSYAAVAQVAYSKSRLRLAARLLEHEVNEERVVRMLVRMKQFAVALRKAESCTDTDLLFLVLFQIQANLPEEALFQLLEAYPVARELFIAHYKQHDRELLRRFYLAWNRPDLVAELLVSDCLVTVSAAAANAHDTGGPWSPAVLKELEAAAALFEASKEHPFEAASLHEMVKLVRLQHKGEGGMSAAGRAVLQGKTVSDSLFGCFLASAGGAQNPQEQQQHALLLQAANRIRTDLRVPERRYCWLRLRALCAAKDWAGLEKFSKERRHPIGFRPFAEACIDAGAPEEAAKYIARIPDAAEREELYRRIGAQPPGGPGGAAGGSTGELLGNLASSAASSAASALFRGWGFS